MNLLTIYNEKYNFWLFSYDIISPNYNDNNYSTNWCYCQSLNSCVCFFKCNGAAIYSKTLRRYGSTPIETNATGWAEFRPILTENTVTYTLNVTDIDNVTAAHIHNGKPNQNWPIVVTLFRPDIPTPKMVSGLLSEGDITSDNLEGPLVDKQISDLLNAMHSMGLYVNVHTTQYPDGEIRGPISNSTSGMMMKWFDSEDYAI